MEGIKFYLFHVTGFDKNIQNLLIRNNYHVDYVFGNEIFVSEDEVYEVKTILDAEGIKYRVEGGE